jgi:ligand-binding sensor domain-containing protein
MVEDLNRNIWFATGGAGIIKYDGTQMKIVNTGNRLKDNVVICSTIDHDGNLWFGTLEGGVNKYITE